MVRKVKVSRKLNPFIDLIALESRADIKLAFTNLFRVQSILVKDLEVDLVLAGTFFNGEGELLVPDWVIGVLEDLGALLVFLVKPELTKKTRVSIRVYANMFQVSNVVLTQRHRSKIKRRVIINSSRLLLFMRTYVAKGVFVLQVFGFDY